MSLALSLLIIWLACFWIGTMLAFGVVAAIMEIRAWWDFRRPDWFDNMTRRK